MSGRASCRYGAWLAQCGELSRFRLLVTCFLNMHYTFYRRGCAAWPMPGIAGIPGMWGKRLSPCIVRRVQGLLRGLSYHAQSLWYTGDDFTRAPRIHLRRSVFVVRG